VAEESYNFSYDSSTKCLPTYSIPGYTPESLVPELVPETERTAGVWKLMHENPLKIAIQFKSISTKKTILHKIFRKMI
jgi:hypothetical protein